jgi:hypothetical protein
MWREMSLGVAHITPSQRISTTTSLLTVPRACLTLPAWEAARVGGVPAARGPPAAEARSFHGDRRTRRVRVWRPLRLATTIQRAVLGPPGRDPHREETSILI